ncbi:hypothetical protein ACQWF3_25325, partial [Salmonella enterica subsp. enterica serovar Infantis]
GGVCKKLRQGVRPHPLPKGVKEQPKKTTTNTKKLYIHKNKNKNTKKKNKQKPPQKPTNKKQPQHKNY